ncbi:hypothetical protein HYX06_05535 [Candidatus Woesearchaeota archaeon]|nr:hypothetical protein [Candidatus Woesearchaeota archaeon]
MKHKLSVSLDERLVQELDRILSTGKYRNKSHAIDFAVRKLLDSSSLTNKISTPAPQTSPEAKNG